MPYFPADQLSRHIGERLDVFLTTALGQSRSHVQALVEAGRVTLTPLHTGALKANTKLRAGQEITVEEEPLPAPFAQMQGEDIPLDILYEDDDFLALNKPPGLVVHPAAGHATGTLVNALLHHCGQAHLAGRGGEERLGIVHRLDKDTSGVMVVAKTDAAHQELARQFHDRLLKKQYDALVWGVPHAGRGELRGNIGRDPHHRLRMAVLAEGGREAWTSYRVEKPWPNTRLPAALVRCELHTGRTHQIRVHLAALRHPIVGDSLYGRARAVPEGFPKPERQMLHAAELLLQHPRTGKPLQLIAPWPRDFSEMIYAFDTLRSA